MQHSVLPGKNIHSKEQKQNCTKLPRQFHLQLNTIIKTIHYSYSDRMMANSA